MPAKIDQYSEQELREIISSSYSLSECCRKLGYSDKGRHGPDRIKEKCKEYNISYEHFSQTKNATIVSTKYNMEEILVENSTYKNISRLKIRLINEGYLEYKCSMCNNDGFWNGQALTLELDHINGQHLDHRIENLRFLCPNCHSQTNTFSGKNKTTTS